MCEEPTTVYGAADKHWFSVGLDSIRGLTEYATQQKVIITEAFAAGAYWQLAQQRKRDEAKKERVQ